MTEESTQPVEQKQKRPLRKNPWYVMGVMIAALLVLQAIAMLMGDKLPKETRVFTGIEKETSIRVIVEGTEYTVADPIRLEMLSKRTAYPKKKMALAGTTYILWGDKKIPFGILPGAAPMTYIELHDKTYHYEGNLLADLGIEYKK